MITVEDALVVIFSRDDGMQLRLTMYEFKAVAEFAKASSPRTKNDAHPQECSTRKTPIEFLQANDISAQPDPSDDKASENQCVYG